MYKFLLIQYKLGRITKEQFDALVKEILGDQAQPEAITEEG